MNAREGGEVVGGHARRERAGNLVKLQRLQGEESASGPRDEAHETAYSRT